MMNTQEQNTLPRTLRVHDSDEVKAIVYDIQRKVNGRWINFNPESTAANQLRLWNLYKLTKAGEKAQIGDWRLKLV